MNNIGDRGKLATFNGSIVTRVGTLGVTISLSRLGRGDFCTTVRVTRGPLYARSGYGSILSIPQGLESDRVGLLGRGRKLVNLGFCPTFLKSSFCGSVCGGVCRLYRLKYRGGVTVNSSFSNTSVYSGVHSVNGVPSLCRTLQLGKLKSDLLGGVFFGGTCRFCQGL